MYYKVYLQELEYLNTEISFLEQKLDEMDSIVWNPFSRKARWERAIIRKLSSLEREVGALNYQFHGDESFPNPVVFMDIVADDNRF